MDVIDCLYPVLGNVEATAAAQIDASEKKMQSIVEENWRLIQTCKVRKLWS